MTRNEKRKAALMPNGVPKWIRCYDNTGTQHETLDCYTVVFTKLTSANPALPLGYSADVSMNGAPFWPQGICQHGESTNGPIDRPTYGHLGRKIRFQDLPEDCQKVVIADYKAWWNIDTVWAFMQERLPASFLARLDIRYKEADRVVIRALASSSWYGPYAARLTEAGFAVQPQADENPEYVQLIVTLPEAEGS